MKAKLLLFATLLMSGICIRWGGPPVGNQPQGNHSRHTILPVLIVDGYARSPGSQTDIDLGDGLINTKEASNDTFAGTHEGRIVGCSVLRG